MTDLTVSGRTPAEYIRGAAYGLAAVGVWSGWIVVARLGLRTSLTPWDIAALRFSVAGLLLLPDVLRKGLALQRLGWIGLGAVILHEPFIDAKIGFVLILLGVFCVASGAGGAIGSAQTLGHALFLGSGLAWACYTVAMRRARLDGLHAAG